MRNKQTLGEALNDLDVARTNFFKALFKSLGIYKLCNRFNLSIKTKWKL